MLKKTGFGWGEITIGGWKDRCSYLNDVPFDLLSGVEETIRTGRKSAVWLDAEGYEYTIVFGPTDTYIITDRDDRTLIVVDVPIETLGEELVSDIRSNIDDWAGWKGDDTTEDEFEERKLDMDVFCKIIERRM